MISGNPLWLLALALAVDAAIGDPDALWKRVPHPVVLIGGLIRAADRYLNHERLSSAWRKALGIISLVLVVAPAIGFGWALETLFASVAYGWIGTVVAVAIMLAGRSLYNHVGEVFTAMETDGIAAARSAIAKIVGRDTEGLDESALSRAAIETTAENFSDGVLAPALWFVVFGLPGLFAYKAINTADSMIGYPSPRYRDFGWAAARLDDLVNWPAARISGFLIAVAAPLSRGSFDTSYRTMRDEAGKHRSPNAGWPEAAMAAALGVSVAGPRQYDGKFIDDDLINAGGRAPKSADIRRALRVYIGAWLNCFLSVAVVAAMTS